MRQAALLVLLASPPGSAAPEIGALLAEADRHFEARGNEAQEQPCNLNEVEAAIAGYGHVLGEDPDAIAARVGLLRTLFFRGAFCGESGEKQRRTFEAAKREAEASQARLERRAGAKVKWNAPEPFRAVPGASALVFWCGLAWGQWAIDHKLAAAWQGAGGRIRDLAETAVALDPDYEQGAPHIVLGRLHAESPRIPFLTSFVSRRKGIEELRKAREAGPGNSVALWFLADALLELEPGRRQEALQLLRECAALEPRPAYFVEDRHYIALARGQLRSLGEDP